MNKIAFISDIHGNYTALEAVWADIENKKIEKVYCLGDLVGYYSQINEVIALIRENNVPTILGNHDYALAFKQGIIDRSKTCSYVLNRHLEYISEDNLSFLKSLPEKLEIKVNGLDILCVHGGLNDFVDEYIDLDDKSYFSSVIGKYDAVISGHTHLPKVLEYDNFIYANSGSVGQPRDGHNYASYLMLEGTVFSIVRVKYNIDETVRQMEIKNFPSYISEVLHKGTRIVG